MSMKGVFEDLVVSTPDLRAWENTEPRCFQLLKNHWAVYIYDICTNLFLYDMILQHKLRKVLFTHTSVFTEWPPCHTQVFYLQMYTSKENSNQGHPTRQPTLVNKPGPSTKSCNWLFIAALKYELKWFKENWIVRKIATVLQKTKRAMF